MKWYDFYKNSPIGIQNALLNFKAYQKRRERYSKGYEDVEKGYFGRDLKNSKQIEEFQKRKLVNFLKQAENSPYWSKVFKKYNVNTDIDSVGDFKKLPILTKEKVLENIEDIKLESYNEGGLIAKKTSGTSGRGLKFYVTKKSEHERWATWWRYRSWHGIEKNDWCGWFGGIPVVPSNQTKPPYWRLDYVRKQIMFSPLHLSQDTFEEYYEKIKTSDLNWLHGYPSQLALLSSYILDAGLDPIEKVKIITTGAENLTQRQRELISNAFQCPVREHYGMAEGVANISEWPDGKLRVDKDFCYVEFIPVNKENSDICKIIGTNINNPAFPLIRYDTGDIAEVTTEENGQIVVKRILGREEDYVTLPNGSRFGPMNLIFKNFHNIREAQVYQPDSEQLIFRIVKDSEFDKDKTEQRLFNEINKRLTDRSVKINFEYLKKLPRTENGKIKSVISDIKK